MGSTDKPGYPRGPKGHWLSGNRSELQKDPIGFTARCAGEYAPVARLRFFYRELYVTSDVGCVREIFLVSTGNYCKGRYNSTLRLLAGNGLITSEGEFWKRQRNLAQPGFHKERLSGFMQIFIDSAYETAARWEGLDKEKVLPLSAEMTDLTLRIAGRALFSIDLASEAREIPNNVKALLRFLNVRNYSFPRFPFGWPVKSHNKFRRRKKEVDRVVYKIIDERMAGTTSGNDLLQLFLEARDADSGEGMSREHVHDEILTILLAGYETSSVALCWTWHLLWEHPQCHEKIRMEVEKVTGGGPLLPEHLAKLEYVRQVLSESLRLYPPVFTIPRESVKDHDLCGMRVKKGCPVLVSVYGLHRNPEYWEDAESFRPERFAPENSARLVKNAYIPFGTGQRICIGQQFAMLEMVAVIAVLARKFIPGPVEGYVPRMVPAITTNVSEGMPVRIRKVQ